MNWTDLEKQSPKSGRLVKGLLLFIVSTWLFVGCSKNKDDDDQPIEPSEFKASDFAITITNASQNAGSTTFSIAYDVKNVTNKDYTLDQHGAFRVKFNVKTTDGTAYQNDRLLPDLDAGATGAMSTAISVSAGKTVDVTTLTHLVYQD